MNTAGSNVRAIPLKEKGLGPSTQSGPRRFSIYIRHDSNSGCCAWLKQRCRLRTQRLLKQGRRSRWNHKKVRRSRTFSTDCHASGCRDCRREVHRDRSAHNDRHSPATTGLDRICNRVPTLRRIEINLSMALCAQILSLVMSISGKQVASDRIAGVPLHPVALTPSKSIPPDTSTKQNKTLRITRPTAR